MKAPKGPSPNPEVEETIEDVHKRYKRVLLQTKLGATAFILVLMAAVAILASALMSEGDRASALEKDLAAVNEIRKEQVLKIEDLYTQVNDLKELKELFDELEGRHTRDLSSYIQDRYKSVPEELAELIAQSAHEKAVEHKVDFGVVVGIMEVESHFNPFAISHKGARGLMQVMFGVWGETLGIEHKTDLHDISLGIDSGIRIYNEYLNEENGNIKRALNRYNGCNLDKGPYAPKVFEAVGRFTAYRNNQYPGGSVNGAESEVEIKADE